MTDIWSLIAQTAPNPGRLLGDPRFLWASLALVVILLIGAVVFAVLDRWRKESGQEDRLGAGEQLAHFRSLYDRGEISREEFERIRAKLGGELRKELDLPRSPPPPAPKPEPGGNGATEPPGPSA